MLFHPHSNPHLPAERIDLTGAGLLGATLPQVARALTVVSKACFFLGVRRNQSSSNSGPFPFQRSGSARQLPISFNLLVCLVSNWRRLRPVQFLQVLLSLWSLKRQDWNQLWNRLFQAMRVRSIEQCVCVCAEVLASL